MQKNKFICFNVLAELKDKIWQFFFIKMFDLHFISQVTCLLNVTHQPLKMRLFFYDKKVIHSLVRISDSPFLKHKLFKRTLDIYIYIY